MENQDWDRNIKLIIKLEERVGRCNRCASLVKCTSKPLVGRGDLQPEVLLVFEGESTLTQDTDWLIRLRKSIKQHFKVANIYHTYLVRCKPKACPHSQGNDFCLTNKLLGRDNICLLTSQPCEGMVIKPTNEAIINCLTFLMEEIDVLQPAYVILLGKRVSDFVLKAYGMLDSPIGKPVYRRENIIFLPAIAEQTFDDSAIESLAESIQDL
jgi:uracil-DNA glycosylase